MFICKFGMFVQSSKVCFFNSFEPYRVIKQCVIGYFNVIGQKDLSVFEFENKGL